MGLQEIVEVHVSSQEDSRPLNAEPKGDYMMAYKRVPTLEKAISKNGYVGTKARGPCNLKRFVDDLL